MKIVTIAAPKGGVGKTTTAVNLAVELASRREGVRILDLDPQASATLTLGGAPLRDLLRREAIPLPERRLSLFPGGRVLDRASRGEVGSIIRRAAYGTELLVIDTPPSLSFITQGALAISALVLVPIEPAPLSLPALAELSRILQSRGATHRLRIVLSRVRKVRRVTREVVETIVGRYPDALYPVAIPEDARAAEALPIRDRHGRAARALRELATWVEADLG